MHLKIQSTPVNSAKKYERIFGGIWQGVEFTVVYLEEMVELNGFVELSVVD